MCRKVNSRNVFLFFPCGSFAIQLTGSRNRLEAYAMITRDDTLELSNVSWAISAYRRVGDRGKPVDERASRRFAPRSEIVIVLGRDVWAKRRVGVLATEERRIGETACRRIKLCLFDRSSFLALRSQIVIILVLGFFIIASRATAETKAE